MAVYMRPARKTQINEMQREPDRHEVDTEPEFGDKGKEASKNWGSTERRLT